MFNFSNQSWDIPKITDILNGSFPPNILYLFTYPWIWLFGGWFFAAFIGAVGCALFIKYENFGIAISFYIIMFLLLGPVLHATTPLNVLPSASIFVYILGVLCSFGLGFILFMVFRNYKDE